MTNTGTQYNMLTIQSIHSDRQTDQQARLAFWLFGFLAFWLFGFLAFWLFGFLAWTKTHTHNTNQNMSESESQVCNNLKRRRELALKQAAAFYVMSMGVVVKKADADALMNAAIHIVTAESSSSSLLPPLHDDVHVVDKAECGCEMCVTNIVALAAKKIIDDDKRRKKKKKKSVLEEEER